MTEVEWLTCDDPTPMLDFLQGKVSDRTARLFASACGRRAWHLMNNRWSWRAVELNERLAEGQATEQERRECWSEANHASLQARRRVTYPEEAVAQAFATAAEAAELILSPSGNWLLPNCGVSAAAAALAYEAAAATELPPAEPWPTLFADEDEQAVAWATRYQEFQRTACFLAPYRTERAIQAGLLRAMVGNPFLSSGST